MYYVCLAKEKVFWGFALLFYCRYVYVCLCATHFFSILESFLLFLQEKKKKGKVFNPNINQLLSQLLSEKKEEDTQCSIHFILWERVEKKWTESSMQTLQA